MTPLCGEEINKAQVEEIVCVFFSLGFLMLLCVFLGPTQYIFHTSMAQYSLFVLKVPLNTKQINKQTNKQTNMTPKQ